MPMGRPTLPGRRTMEGKAKLLKKENIPGDILKQVYMRVTHDFIVKIVFF